MQQLNVLAERGPSGRMSLCVDCPRMGCRVALESCAECPRCTMVRLDPWSFRTLVECDPFEEEPEAVRQRSLPPLMRAGLRTTVGEVLGDGGVPHLDGSVVLQVPADAPLAAVAALMAFQRVREARVVNADGEAVGFVTVWDLLTWMAKESNLVVQIDEGSGDGA